MSRAQQSSGLRGSGIAVGLDEPRGQFISISTPLQYNGSIAKTELPEWSDNGAETESIGPVTKCENIIHNDIFIMLR